MRNSAIQSAYLETVVLDRINSQDESYRITTRPDIDELLMSIRHEGLLSPPLLIKRASVFVIVSGFRRIAVCRQLGCKKIDARVLGPDIGALDCLRLAIADNAFQRPLNLIEISRSLQKLSALLNNSKRLTESAATLGLPTNPSIIAKMKDLCLLPPSIQRAILDQTVSLSMAVELGNLDPEDAIAFVRLFNQLKLSLNKQREIVTLVREIAERDSISIEQVMERKRLHAMLNRKDLDRGHMGRKIRSILRQERYPRLVATERLFDSYRKKLKLGEGIKLTPPKEFEGNFFTLTLSFNSLTHLKKLQTRMNQIIENPWLDKIFKIK